MTGETLQNHRNIAAPNTAGGVTIDMSGRIGDERRVGGWPNLVEAATGAIRHLNELADPNYSYLSYVGATLGTKTPSFSRCMWDWIEASSYGLLGRISARRLTGMTDGEEVEIGQRRLLLASFHNLDGFAHRTYAKGWSEDTKVIIWEQARVLYALMAWFLESQDEQLLSYARGMLQALLAGSRKEGDFRRFNPPYDKEWCFGEVAQITLVEPLMKYYEVTGDPEALEFCEGIINWAVDPATNLVDDQYRWSAALRGPGAALASIARFACHVNDEKILAHAERMLRSGLELCSAYGATPDTEPCCTNMELTTAMLALTKAGYGQWWDTIDRFFRNQTLECRFLDPSMVNCGYIEGEPGPYDDTRDILNRSVGGFSWATAREHRYDPGMLMLCCTGNAMWTLGKIVEHAVTQDDRGLSVNLHFTLDTPLASTTSHEPFEGRIEVVPHRAGSLRIRKPSYATRAEAELDGAPAEAGSDGDYLVFDSVKEGSTLVLVFDMPEKTTEETVMKTPGDGYFAEKSDPEVDERIRTTWRGNTVMAIDYDSDSPQPKHRLYLNRAERCKNGEGRDDMVRFFLPDKTYEW